jgi:hypothetical protein
MPSSIPKMTEATIATVTIWLVMAMKAGSEEPKNAIATSGKNIPEIISTMYSEKQEMVKEKTNSIPTEDFWFESGSNCILSYRASV